MSHPPRVNPTGAFGRPSAHVTERNRASETLVLQVVGVERATANGVLTWHGGFPKSRMSKGESIYGNVRAFTTRSRVLASETERGALLHGKFSRVAL